MIAPVTVSAIVTVCAEEYVPAAGENVGVGNVGVDVAPLPPPSEEHPELTNARKSRTLAPRNGSAGKNTTLLNMLHVLNSRTLRRKGLRR
jgi:hypothetical protein